MGWLAVLGIGGTMVGTIVLVLMMRRRARLAWQELATRNGLDFSGHTLARKLTVRGRYEGVDVLVRTERESSGSSDSIYTIYSASLPSGVPFDLTVYEEGMLSAIDKMFGGQDIEVGDEEIDASLVIKSDHPGEVRDFFEKSGVREVFRRVGESELSFKFDHGMLTVREGGLEGDLETLERTLELIVEVSKSLEEAVGQSGSGGHRLESSEGEGDDAPESSQVEEDYVAEW